MGQYYLLFFFNKELQHLTKLLILIKTILKLGIINVICVFFYRLCIKSKFSRILFPQKYIQLKNGLLLSTTKIKKVLSERKQSTIEEAEKIVNGGIYYYGFHKKRIGNTPNWFYNPFNGVSYKKYHEHWSQLPDFDPTIGDIKNIWEASRFNWLVTLATAYTLTLEERYLNTINNWIQDWAEKNPINTGPNWKCGQESSLRAINTLLAYEIIDANGALHGFKEFLKTHIDRIAHTTYYAKSQDNNHGISEGVALYILGYFLWNNTNEKKYYSLHRQGYKLLEERVKKLILNDGSFSQHSIVYHRMLLDLLSIVEIFRLKWILKPFSKSFYSKVEFAILWYSALIDQISGNAPNIGANDGTYLFNLGQTEYRDFRPSLTLAASIFKININKRLKSHHPFIDIFSLAEIEGYSKKFKSLLFREGGYTKLVRDNGFVFLRLPVYNFRPTHSDALHLDIWQDGINWIRDAGSYSYALPFDEQDKFTGTTGHSTIQFDDRNQMPRLSRFLFGEWLTPTHIDFNPMENSIDSGYIDFRKAQHRRKVSAYKNGWEIIDTISGSFKRAVQRWILAPGNWEVEDSSIRNGNIFIIINSERICRFEMVEGEESLFYMQKTPVQILEVELQKQCTIVTNIIFKA